MVILAGLGAAVVFVVTVGVVGIEVFRSKAPRRLANIEAVHKSYAPNLLAYCSMSAGTARSLTAPRTGLDAAFAQNVANYAPVAIRAQAQAVADYQLARQDGKPTVLSAAQVAAVKMDAYHHTHC